jgi:hypothetical protein
MKATLEIPEDELRRTMELSGAKTESEAVTAALVDFNQRHRQSELLKYSGTLENMMTIEELHAMRAME